MSLNQKNLLGLCVAGATLASSAVVFSANPAQAATFNVNGTDYEITTVTGTYLGLQDQLVATPWWGNETLATTIANQVAGQLGILNSIGPTQGGPLFAYQLAASLNTKIYLQGSVPTLGIPLNTTYRYAVGSAVVGSAAVPEPLTILGSITAAGFGVAFKRKKNSSKEE